MSSSEKEFTGLRAVLWPIHKFELKKFIPTVLIMFCILFNYTVMRDMKDALVVNSSMGAAGINLLKLLITPCAVIFVLIYSKLVNVFDSEKVFYMIIIPFLVFFGLFGFVLYPMVDSLHMSKETVEHLYSLSTQKWVHQLIDLASNWSFALFYILSEIWGSAMIALMFWQYANRITRKSEAKRFYGLFQAFGNSALILSGALVIYCSKPTNFTWGMSVKLMCAAIVVAGLVTIATYRWMHTNVLNDKKYYDPAETASKKSKVKLGFKDSFMMLIRSKELRYIAVLMFAYGISVNLIEVQWKDQMKTYFEGRHGDYNTLMGYKSSFEGATVILFSWFIGSNIIRRCSWIVGAIITPLLILTLGLGFFGCILSQDLMTGVFGSLISSPLAGSVFIGLATVVLSKSIKYALFDPTKDLAYMTLDEEAQTKGKAAVDVIGGRGGKAGGALIQQSFLVLCATKSLIVIAPYTAVVFTIVCACWIWAVIGLSRTIAQNAQRASA